ncbi:hypothetical protein ACN28E_11990 [Archangium lansingense]|uniref:hypothetical protein n=1 Tax=Archangium lansingense TaxID=2995310 RepID=UPI003B820CA3
MDRPAWSKRPSGPFGRLERWSWKLPGSKVVALEGAEHDVWLSHPERVVREMKDFLGP